MLHKMFNPSSIALIGVSPDPRKLGHRLLHFLQKYQYPGEILPVNPKYDQINGLKCYPRIADLPDTDVALITLPAKLVEDILEECADRGIKHVILYSSGFAEVGEKGKVLQQRIVDLAKRNNMSILGPNCHGLVNLMDSIPMSFNTALDIDEKILSGKIGFVSQSGALATYILAVAREQGIGFSYWVTTGNEAGIDFCDCISYLLDEPRTEVICVYIEEIRDGEKFIQCAKKASKLGKPIVALKVGRSDSGSVAASSHTGAITGSDEAYEAIFKRYGIIRAMTIQELLDYTLILAPKKYPRSSNVAIATISGGGGIIMADDCEDFGLSIPQLSRGTRDRLAEIVPVFGSTRNPVDLTAQLITQPELLKDSLQIITEDTSIETVAIFLGLQHKTGDILAKGIAEVAQNTHKLFTVAWMVPPMSAVRILSESNVPVFTDATRCVKAIGAAVKYQKFQLHKEFPAGRITSISKVNSIKKELQSLIDKGRGALSEAESMQIMSHYGISTPKMRKAKSAEEAIQFAEEIGFPVVLKIDSPDVLHKSDIGAVKVGIGDVDAVAEAFNQIMASVKGFNDKADIHGVIVEEMLPAGTEVIIGAKVEKPFGPIITFGLGGIYVELLRDVSYSPAPLSQDEAKKLIEAIKSHKVLQGYRGKPPADLSALSDMLVKFSYFAHDLKGIIKEIDLNPVIVYGKGEGCVALDALIVLK